MSVRIVSLADDELFARGIPASRNYFRRIGCRRVGWTIWTKPERDRFCELPCDIIELKRGRTVTRCASYLSLLKNSNRFRRGPRSALFPPSIVLNKNAGHIPSYQQGARNLGRSLTSRQQQLNLLEASATPASLRLILLPHRRRDAPRE